MLAYLVADLMWQSRVDAAARAAGVVARRVRSWDQIVPMLELGSLRLLLLDLTDPEAGQVLSQSTAGTGSGVRVIGFGPHVETELLDQARASGAEVLPRGAMARRLDEIIRTLAEPDGGEGG